VWKDQRALVKLAATADVAEQPVQLLVALGARLPVADVHTMRPQAFAVNLVAAPASPSAACNVLASAAFVPGATDAVEFLRRVQQEYPDDFWANFALGNALMKQGSGEAVLYFQAALALRPQAAAVHNNLGLAYRALRRYGLAIDVLKRALRVVPKDPVLHNNLGITLTHADQPAEAIGHFRQALAALPGSALVHNNLGIALKATGKEDEAGEEYRKAIRLAPKDHRLHSNLARLRLNQGRLDEAIEQLREASRLLPTSGQARIDLGNALLRRGRLDEAIEQYRWAVRLGRLEPRAHYHLGNALMMRGRTEEAVVHLKQAIQLAPQMAAPHFCLGRISKTKGRLDEAIRSYRQAAQLDADFALAHFELGKALKEVGQYDEAVQHFKLSPSMGQTQGALGQALVLLGRFREGRAALLRCLELLPEGDPGRAPTQQVLRQCDQLLALEHRLPAILQGKEAPANGTEGTLFAELCHFKQKHVAAARLYAAAMKASPTWFEAPQKGLRYNAACSAALASCGGEEEGEKLSEADRARWRKEARAWLRADLAAWGRMAASGPAPARILVLKVLTRWQIDPALAGLRGPALLGLAPGEREQCRALWDEVREVWLRAQARE
jgi:tetratricopeptide (TPR) repeat protein